MRERIMRFVAIFLSHDRDTSDPPDFGVRVLMHIPIGFVIGLFAPLPGLCLATAYLFKFYERNEDAHHEDEAWKDTFGALVGIVIAGLCWSGVIIWLVILLARYLMAAG